MSDISLEPTGEEIARIKLDFDQIEAWRNEENDDLPVYSFLSFYKAAGLMPYLEKFCEDGKQVAALDNLACNFYTLQRIKNYITDNWKIYSFNIEKDNTVSWDESQWPKNTKHYKKTLSSKITRSLWGDFANYCPALDDDLPDNILLFKTYDKKD